MFSEKIKQLRKSKGITQAELAQVIKVSKSAICNYEKGFRTPDNNIIWKRIADYFNVSIDYLMDCEDSPTRSKNISYTYSNILPIETKTLPILGAVACGEPIYAPEEANVCVTADSHIDADFALRAVGDSMINARIHDGDIVFIKAQPEVESGEIAAVAINDEVTLKRVYYYQNEAKLVLTPENPAYAPMVFTGAELDPINILGKAVAFHSIIR